MRTTMWDHYRKTFVKTQLVIALITAMVFYGTHHMALVTAVFFGMMQLGSIAGSMWAARLKNRLHPGMW